MPRPAPKRRADGKFGSGAVVKKIARGNVRDSRKMKAESKREAMDALKTMSALKRKGVADDHPVMQTHRAIALNAYKKHAYATAWEKVARKAAGQKGASTVGKLDAKSASALRKLEGGGKRPALRVKRPKPQPGSSGLWT